MIRRTRRGRWCVQFLFLVAIATGSDFWHCGPRWWWWKCWPELTLSVACVLILNSTSTSNVSSPCDIAWEAWWLIFSHVSKFWFPLSKHWWAQQVGPYHEFHGHHSCFHFTPPFIKANFHGPIKQSLLAYCVYLFDYFLQFSCNISCHFNCGFNCWLFRIDNKIHLIVHLFI